MHSNCTKHPHARTDTHKNYNHRTRFVCAVSGSDGLHFYSGGIFVVSLSMHAVIKLNHAISCTRGMYVFVRSNDFDKAFDRVQFLAQKLMFNSRIRFRYSQLCIVMGMLFRSFAWLESPSIICMCTRLNENLWPESKLIFINVKHRSRANLDFILDFIYEFPYFF